MDSKNQILKDLLVEIRESRVKAQKRVRKYYVIVRFTSFIISLMNVITLIVLVMLIISTDQETATIIASLANHILMFLVSSLQEGSGILEIYSNSKHILEEIVALDRDLSLIIFRNNLNEDDIAQVYTTTTDRLSVLEQNMIFAESKN